MHEKPVSTPRRSSDPRILFFEQSNLMPLTNTAELSITFDIAAKCIGVKFPDVRCIVHLVVLPDMEGRHSSVS